MLLLTSTSDKIQVITSTIATVEVDAAYVDNFSGIVTPGRRIDTLSSIDIHDVVPAPTAGVQRNLRTLIVRNDHVSLSNGIEINHTDGVDTVTLWSGGLQAKEQVVLNQLGDWKTYDANGLEIIQAVVGATGPVGSMGDTGPQGPQGIQGPAGTTLAITTLSHTTASLAAAASEDFTIASGALANLLAVTASFPAWIRVYGTSAARTADTRTSPGGTPPISGSGFYAELATTTTPQTIQLSPVATMQGDPGNVYMRVKNMDSVSRAIALDFSILTLVS